MFKSISNFLFFLKKPYVFAEIKKNNRLKAIISLLIFSFIIESLLTLFTNSRWLINLLKIDTSTSFEKDAFQRGILYMLVTIGIVAPIIEELLFRSYLRSFIWNNFFLPINICFIFWSLFRINSQNGILILIIIALIAGCGICLVIKQSEKLRNKIVQFYKKEYWIYFYLSAFSFALLHLTNYKIQNFVPVLPVLLILPLVFAGLLLGYIRITMGLKWSIYFHALHNIIYVLIFFFSYST